MRPLLKMLKLGEYEAMPCHDVWPERKLVKRLICAVKGHDWVITRFRELSVNDTFPPHFVMCARCKDVAARIAKRKENKNG